jgi:hypothetical protein
MKSFRLYNWFLRINPTIPFKNISFRLYKNIIVIIFLTISISSLAQGEVPNPLKLIPDKAAKEQPLIYLHKAPDWEKKLSNINGIRISNSGDNIYSKSFAFGDRPYGNRRYSKWQSLDVTTWKFSKLMEGKSIVLEGFKTTNNEDIYASVEFLQSTNELKLSRVDFSYEEPKLTEISNDKLLEAINKSGFSITNASYAQCQDLDYFFIDITIEAEQLEGHVIERHWLTVDMRDFSVLHNIEQPFTNSSKGIYIVLVPYGIKDAPLSYLSKDEMRNYNMGYNHSKFEPGTVSYTKPGKDFIIARYRDNTFWDNRMAVVKVNMKTGERTFLNPPQKHMIMSAANFVMQKNYPNSEILLNRDTLWMCRNSLREDNYEVFFHYDEKENTYTTISYFGLEHQINAQLVLQNQAGEYYGRNANPGISIYRVREMGTNKIVHEYSLLSSLPLKISHDNRYMVFLEGTPQENVTTIRDFTSGNLVYLAPGLTSITATPIIYENKDGIIIGSQKGTEIQLSFFRYKEEPETPQPNVESDNNKKSFTIDYTPKIASRVTQKYTYTKDGLLAPGNKIDNSFCFHLFWNGLSVAFNKDTSMSPQNIGLLGDLSKYQSRYYSWYAGMVNSRNVGFWVNYNDETSLKDWHGNYIIKPDSKYEWFYYLNNDLLWLKEAKDNEKNYVFDTRDMSLTKISVKGKLRMIFQSKDNKFLFPLMDNGDLYRMEKNGDNLLKISSNINWVTLFYINNKSYMMAYTKDTRKAGIISYRRRHSSTFNPRCTSN